MLNSEVVWDSGRTRKAVKRRHRRRTMASVVSPVEILWRITGGMAKGRPQRPASAFVFLKGGDSGVINISSVTWDCFLADVAERNMKWASDGHQAILAPRGPFTAFKSCFYSSSLLFSGTFFCCPQKQLWCISSQALYGFDEAAGGTAKVKPQTLWCIRVFRVCFQNDASSFSEDGVFNFFSGRRSDILSSKQVEEPDCFPFIDPLQCSSWIPARCFCF